MGTEQHIAALVALHIKFIEESQQSGYLATADMDVDASTEIDLDRINESLEDTFSALRWGIADHFGVQI